MKRLFSAVVLVLIISSGFAENVGGKITSINAEIIINPDLSATEKFNVKVFNSYSFNSSYVYVFLSNVPSSYEIVDENNTHVNSTSFVANGVFTIRILDDVPPNSSKKYTIIMSNDDVVQDFDANNIFSYSFTSYYDLEDFYLKLTLPTGFGITKREGNTVSPPTSRLYSDGQQIIIEWVDDMSYLETNTYLVFFEKIAFTNFSIIWLLITGLTGFVLGALLNFYLFKRKRKEIVTMALTKDEKSIVDFVLEEGNDVYQNRIGKALDFSKPKLSKIVHNLEDKNIVRINRHGRKNKIKINEEIL